MALAETRMTPYREKIPQSVFPFLLSALRVVTAASFPLLLLFAFALLNEMIDFDATWFKLIGNLLTLWAIGALAMGLMRELLTGDLFAVTVDAVP
jgi:hypothetical protein